MTDWSRSDVTPPPPATYGAPGARPGPPMPPQSAGWSPPPLSGDSWPSYQSAAGWQPQQPSDYPQVPNYGPPVPVQYALVPVQYARKDGLGTAGFWLALVGFFLPWVGNLLSVAAIIMCGISMGRTPPAAPGRGLAIAGLVIGIVGLAIFFW